MTPLGSMSATRVDFGPLLERLKMQLAQNQFGAQMQQQQQFHQGEMDLAGLKLNAQESQFTRGLAEQQAGREQQGALVDLLRKALQGDETALPIPTGTYQDTATTSVSARLAVPPSRN